MKLSFNLFCVYALLVFIPQAQAYEIHTHTVITQKTVGRTVLSDTQFFSGLGLDLYNNDFGESRNSLNGWFMRGVIREDDCWIPGKCKNPLTDPVNVNGPLNHFFDPYNNQGLLFVGEHEKAPNWALGTQDAFTSPLTPLPDYWVNLNHYTIFSAKEAMVRALSGQYTDSMRMDNKWHLLFI